MGVVFWSSDVLASLIEVSLACFGCFRIVFLHVLFCEEWPTDVVSCFDCF